MTRRTLQTVSMAALAIGLLNARPVCAQSRPSGGTVVSGGVTIGDHIVQTTNRAIINWNSFNLGQSQGLQIDQPSASAVLLNRVTGPGASQIDGFIYASGGVYIVNPDGVTIGPGGGVFAKGGVVLSTLDISDDDFNAGNLRFSGTHAGAVNVQGGIESDAYAALLGARASVSGTITVKGGRIGVGAASSATLDLNGDGFLQVVLPSDDPDVTNALVDVSGTLNAYQGGRITLAASTAADAVRNAINMSGTLTANAVEGTTGNIQLVSTGAGSITSTGTITTPFYTIDRSSTYWSPSGAFGSSSFPDPGQAGGVVSIVGQGAVNVSGNIHTWADPGIGTQAGGPNAILDITGKTVNVSGLTAAADYSTIRIGGGAVGGLPALATADTVSVSGSSLNAANGYGGGLVVTSIQSTTFGGNNSTKANTIAINSLGVVTDFGFAAFPDVSSVGSPLSITLGAQHIQISPGGNGSSGQTSLIDRDQLASFLLAGRGTLTLQAGDTIAITDGLPEAIPGGGFSASSLALQAGRSISLAGIIALPSATLGLSANVSGANGGGRGSGAATIDVSQATFKLGSDPDMCISWCPPVVASPPGSLAISLLGGTDHAVGGTIRLGSGTIDGNVSLAASEAGAIHFSGDLTATGSLSLNGNLQFAGSSTITGQGGVSWPDQATTSIVADHGSQTGYTYDYLVRSGTVGNYTTVGSGTLADLVELPTAGFVSTGTATIATPSLNTLAVTQTTERAIIDWTSFSIGTGGTVTFLQPDSGAITLNRVSGSSGSNILGTLSANGGVYLVNPNGISIGASGVVDTHGGFLASSMQIDPTSFMAGKLVFGGAGTGNISNAGSITTDNGALGALVGASITNSGTIATGSNGDIRLIASGSGTLTTAGGTLTGGSLTLGARDIAIGASNPTAALSLTTASLATLSTGFGNISIEAGNHLTIGSGLDLSGFSTVALAAGRSLTASGMLSSGSAPLSLSGGGVATTIGTLDRATGTATVDLSQAALNAGDLSIRTGSGGLIALPTLTSGFANLTVAAPGGAIRFTGDVTAATGTTGSLTGSLQFAADATISAPTLAWTDSATASVRGWGNGASGFIANATLASGGTTLFRGRLTDAVATRIDLTGLSNDPSLQYGVSSTDLAGLLLHVTSGSLASGDTLGSLLAPGGLTIGGAGTGRLALGSYALSVTAPSGAPQAGDAAGYFFDLRVPAQSAITIIPRVLTYALGSVSQTYGTAATTSTTLNNVLSGDTVLADVAATSGGSAYTPNALLNAGSYVLSVSGITGADAGNYVLAATGNTIGSLSVAQKSLTFDGSRTTSIYGNAVTQSLGQLSGILGGDTVSAQIFVQNSGGAFALTDRTAAGTYGIVATGLTGTSASNYTIGTQNVGALTISPRPISASLSNLSYTYGSPLTALTLNGVLSGDQVTPVTTLDNGAITLNASGGNYALADRTNVGTYSLAQTGIGGRSAANYSLTGLPPVATISITPRLLTYTTPTLDTTYGSTSAGISLSNVLDGDDVGTTVLAQANGATSGVTAKLAAGTYSLVAGALTGTAASNYRFADSNSQAGTLTVDKKGLTLVAASTTAVYGTTPAFAGRIDGLLSGDSITPGFSFYQSSVVGNRPVGTYDYNGFGLTGADAGNYTIILSTISTATITPKPVTAVYSGVGGYTYGSPSALVSLSGVLGGDAVAPVGAVSGINADLQALTGGWGLADNARVGSYQFGVSGLTGAGAGNYMLVPSSTFALSITPRALNWSGLTGSSIYGNPTTASAAIDSGIVGGDQVGLLAGLTSTTGTLLSGNARLNVGRYGVVATGLTGADADNYVLATSANTAGAYSITPRPLDYAIAGVASTYGTLATPSAQLPGILPGDTVSAIVGARSGNASVAVTDRLGAGTYALDVSALQGASAGNYMIGGLADGSGLLTVAPLALGFAASSGTSVYGNLASLTGTLSGILSGDTVTPIFGFTDPNGTIAAATRTNAGSYGVTATGLTGAGAVNYTIGTGINGAWTITPRPVGYDVTGAHITFGDPLAQSTTLSGVLTGDAVGGQITVFDASGNVVSGTRLDAGTYTAKVANLTGSAAGNYFLDPTLASAGLLTVDPRRLALPTSLSATYGTAITLPSLFTNVAAGDVVGFTPVVSNATGTAIPYSRTTDAGSYSLRAVGFQPLSSSTKLSNYVIDPTSASAFTIARKSVSVAYTANVFELTYGDAIPTTGAAITGILAEDAGAVAIAYAAQGAASGSGNLDVGIYSLGGGLGGSRASNYVIASQTGSLPELIVVPKVLSIGWTGAMSRTYGSSYLPRAVLQGVFAGDNVQPGGVNFFQGSDGSDPRTMPGTYNVIVAGGLAGGDSRNYALPSQTLATSARFVIDKAVLTLAGITTSQVYGSFVMPTLTGAVNGDNVQSSLVLSSGGNMVVPNSLVGVGTYQISGKVGAGGWDSYYTVDPSLITGFSITVTPRTLDFSGAGTLAYANPFSAANLSGLFSNLAAGDIGRISPVFQIGAAASTGKAADGSFLDVGAYRLTLGSLGGAAGANYVLGANGADLTITPRPIAGTFGSSSVYGLATSFNYGSLTLPTGTAQDGVRLSATVTGGPAASNGYLGAGTYQLTGPTLAGADAKNYTLDLSFASTGTITIAPRDLTFTVGSAASGNYGPNESFTPSLNLRGLLGNDQVFATPLIGGIANGVGLTPGQYFLTAALGGAAASNYVVSDSSRTVFDVLPMVLTPSRLSIVYGGSAYDPSALFGASTNAFLSANGVRASATFNSLTGADERVTLTGDHANWFSISGNLPSLILLPRPVIIAAGFSATYGEFSTTSLAGVEMGVVGGESGLLPGTRFLRQWQPLYNVGSYALPNLDYSFSDSHYVANWTGTPTLTITPRPVSFTQLSSTSMYGNTTAVLDSITDAPWLAMAYNSLSPNIQITNYAGSVSVGSFLDYLGKTDQFANAGTYTFKVGSLNNPNFVATDQRFTLTIQPRPITSYTFDNSASGIYGDTLTLLSLFAGASGAGGLYQQDIGKVTPIWTSISVALLANINAGYTSQSRADALGVAAEAVAVNANGLKPLDIGTYSYALAGLGGEKGGNYSLAPLSGTVTFAPKPLTLDITTSDRFYGMQTTAVGGCLGCGMVADPRALFTLTGGLANTDVGASVSLVDASGQTSAWSAKTNAGTYGLAEALNGADAKNYKLDPSVKLPTSFVVQQAVLGYTISLGQFRQSIFSTDAMYVRGIGYLTEHDPQLTFNGLVNGDVASMSIRLFPGSDTSVRGAGSVDPDAVAAGAYHLQIASASATSNYQVAQAGSQYGNGERVQLFTYDAVTPLSSTTNASTSAATAANNAAPESKAMAASGTATTGSASSTSLKDKVLGAVEDTVGFNPLSVVDKSVGASASGTTTTSVGSATVTATGTATADASVKVTLGTVDATASASAGGSVRVEYGPGYTEVGAQASASAEVKINLLSKNPSIVATGAAQAGAYVVTGVEGSLGNGATGNLDTGAQAAVSAQGSVGFSYTDGTIKPTLGGVAGAGVSADVNAGVSGAVGSVGAGAGAGVQVGSIGASIQPTIGFDGSTVNVGLSLQLDIGIGINLNFNFSINFAEIGDKIGGALKDAANAVLDAMTCEADCQAQRREDNKRNTAIAAFGDTIATLNPFTQYSQMQAAVATYQAACTSCDISKVPTAVVQVVADSGMIDNSKRTFQTAVSQAQAIATSGAGKGVDWANASTVIMELNDARDIQASAVRNINDIGAKYGAVLVATPGGELGLAKIASPSVGPLIGPGLNK